MIADSVEEAPRATLIRGPARYRPDTPWKPVPAILVTGLVFIGQVIGVVVAIALIRLGPPWLQESLNLGNELSLSSPGALLIMILSQVTSIALVWLAAGWKGGRLGTLQLSRPPRRWPTYLEGGLLIIVATGTVELLFYRGLGYDIVADTGDLARGMNSPWWPGAVLMAVVLAPLWEELTFRGFLLSALAQSRLGFRGAALVTNSAWTALHWNYSAAGLTAVFTAGTVLTWLLWRTGSIRVPIAAHGIANLFAVLFAFWMGGGLS